METTMNYYSSFENKHIAMLKQFLVLNIVWTRVQSLLVI